MGKEYDVDAMLARQREIADEIERLTKESDELDVALRVIRRFETASGVTEGKHGPARPEDTPTLYEMTVAVIEASESRSGRGLLIREIVREIGREFWPGVNGPQITPSIYGYVKNGRLLKNNNGRFHTAKKDKAPTGEPEGASKVTGEVAASPKERRGLF